MVTELAKDFGRRKLPAGTYIAASDGSAYGPLLGLIERGGAQYIGTHTDTRGRKVVGARVGRQGNPTIGLGAGYFTGVLREYSDWREKWWREAIQNSVDAGAKEILCGVVENPDGTWTVSMQDNGKGMSLTTLTDTFLSMGGTTKRGATGVAGGFGKAKELLLFPWITWEIHTQNKVARGSGAEYVVEDVPNLRGTRITVVMAADEHTTGQAALAFIEKCYLPGVRFKVSHSEQHQDRWEKTVHANLRADDLLEAVPGKADVYVVKVKYSPWTMFIRVNGLYMFSKYVGDTGNRQVVVEVTVSSLQAFTSNRDGFSDGGLDRALGSLAERVAKDVSSALRTKKGLVRQRYQGAGKFKAKERQSSALAQIGPILATKAGVVTISASNVTELSEVVHHISISKGGTAVPNRELATELLSNVTFAGAHHVEEAVRQLVWEPDFFLINEIEGFKVPAKFRPETMAPRVTKLVRVWTELCRFVLMQLGNFREFGVGLVFSQNAGAMYSREDGEEWLLINPYKDFYTRKIIWSPTTKDDLKWLYAAAVHECTHLADGIMYHDESFATALTFNIAKTADGFKHLRGIVNSIRMRDAGQTAEREDNPRRPLAGLSSVQLVNRLKF